MKAVVQEAYGAPRQVLELRDIDKPVAGEQEVVVEVAAAGVAIGDWLIARGLPVIARPSYGLRRPKARVAGLEMSGRVESVGEGVTDFQPGDAVFGWCSGALAEYVVVSQDSIATKPAALTFEQAAAVPISASAALQALRDTGRIQPNQRVAITGASGAVGTFAVQIAKAFGAEVTGVCSTRNVDLVESIGADHVVDYTREDLGQQGPRYDLIADLAGNRSIADLRRALDPKGTLVIIGGSGGSWTMGFGRTLRAAALSPSTAQRLRPFFSATEKQDLVVLRELVEVGELSPVIDREYSLETTAVAVDYVGERHTRGKTVVVVGGGTT